MDCKDAVIEELSRVRGDIKTRSDVSRSAIPDITPRRDKIPLYSLAHVVLLAPNQYHVVCLMWIMNANTFCVGLFAPSLN